MSEIMNAMVIKIDGIDGCGKTTLINELSRSLSRKYKILCSSEFGSNHDISVNEDCKKTSLSALLKSFALNPGYQFDDIERELLWAIISRRHNRLILQNLMKQAELILVDRSDFGNFAYGKILDSKICQVFESYTKPLEIRDWTFWLDTPVDICLSRLENNTLDDVESKGESFFHSVRSEYEKLSSSTENTSTIDGSLDLSSQVEIVSAHIAKLFSCR